LSIFFGQSLFLKEAFAEIAYARPVLRHSPVLAMLGTLIEALRRRDRAKGFVVLPQRRIAERTIT
jgi:hypothetical protein